jgi:hypothetical protein
VTVRFGNVLGSNGSVIPSSRSRSRGRPGHGDPPGDGAVLHDHPGGVAARAAGRLDGQGGEIFILDMGEPVKIVRAGQGPHPAVGARAHRHRDRVHRRPPRREAVRGAVDRGRGADKTHHPKIFVGRIAVSAPTPTRRWRAWWGPWRRWPTAPAPTSCATSWCGWCPSTCPTRARGASLIAIPTATEPGVAGADEARAEPARAATTGAHRAITATG